MPSRISSQVCLSFAVIRYVELLHRPIPPRRLNAQGGVLAPHGFHHSRVYQGSHNQLQYHHTRGSHLARMGYPTQT